MSDRAHDLKTTDDLWPLVEERLHRAVDMAMFSLIEYRADPTILEEKFRRGEAEHGRDWLDMSRDEFDQEILDEGHDLVLYHAMRMLRWGRGPNGWVEP